MDKERRFLPITDAEFRVADDGEGTTMTGYAAVFDQRSENLGGFTEIIRKGAFTRAIKEDDVKALWNHDSNIVLGSTSGKTLRMKEDDKGLKIEVDLDPENQTHRDLVTLPMKRGDINKMSFGFTVSKDGDKWNEDDTGAVTRELLDVGLFDVSPVTYPAYNQTSVAVRSLEDAGLSHERLSGLALKAEKGFALNDKDKADIESAIETLRSYLPEEESDESEAPAWLDVMRHKLRMAEAISNVKTTPERSES